MFDRFGNPYLVANAYKKKIKEWPNVPPNDGISLRKFSDFLVHCQAATKEIHYLQALNDPEENQKIVRKLPQNICAQVPTARTITVFATALSHEKLIATKPSSKPSVI